jgi:hypothetical protein
LYAQITRIAACSNMSKTLYFVRGWESHYENAHSRKVHRLAWVPLQNRHDGVGFRTVMAHRRASEIYVAWVLALQVASRCEPRGFLIRTNGQPHTAASLAAATGGREAWFTFALPYLVDEVGWLRCHEATDMKSLHAYLTSLPQSRDDTSHGHGAPSHGHGAPSHGHGVEGKGREVKGKKRERKRENAASPRRFIKPTIEAVRLRASEIGLPDVEAEKFYFFYEAKGWCIGRDPMKNWHSAMTGWHTRWKADHTPEANERHERIEAKLL